MHEDERRKQELMARKLREPNAAQKIVTDKPEAQGGWTGVGQGLRTALDDKYDFTSRLKKKFKR